MKIVFSDFDGTLTTPSGRLDAAFYELVELVEQNESQLVVVSGRSVSWGHFLLTHFPLKHVIMEGGGIIVTKNKEGELSEEVLLYDEDVKELELLTQKMCQEIPEVVMSLDSYGRKTDRAIEYHMMEKEDIDRVETFLHDNGASFSRSNVHINYWLGDISKSYAVDYYLKHYAAHIEKDECIYYGDSLNDESMFQHFPNTVGVSNIINVLDKLQHKPAIILEGKDNAGVHGVLTHLKEVFNQSVDF
jgi:HAD superfamily hydrolase (TIGR01484 family)